MATPQELVSQISATYTRLQGLSSTQQWLLDDMSTILAMAQSLDASGGSATPPSDPSLPGPNIPTGAAYNAEPIDLSSGDHILAPGVRAIDVGGSGDLALQLVDGSTAVFKNRPAGSVFTYQVAVVLQAGTTATDLVALR